MTGDEIVATMSGNRYAIYHTLEKVRELVTREILPAIDNIETCIFLAEDLEAEQGLRGLNYDAPDHALEYISKIEQKIATVKKYCHSRGEQP
jgi:hypothetical protein